MPCAPARQNWRCCRARTAWPAGCPTSTSCFPAAACTWSAEHFQRVEHCLIWCTSGSSIGGVRRVHSHPVALGQVRNILRELDAEAVVESDTAGSAELIAAWNRPEDAAIASELAAEIHGLQVLRKNVEDAAHNTTRFYVTALRPRIPPPETPALMTTFVFRVRNVPAALYKALGGFATNGVNMTKLESYMVDGQFTATEFLCDVDGHPEQPALRRALEELQFFSREIRVLGVYPRAVQRGSAAGD